MKWRLISLAFACALSGFITSTFAQATYTSLGGFWDYQTNYRTNQYIRICPNTQMIHVIMMVADDSLNPSASRRTAYALSTNGGMTWNTFGQIRVPNRRSGYPSLDILQGAFSCCPIIANHNTISAGLQSIVFIDAPPGGGAFAELNPPPLLGGNDEPGFPEVAGTADGSVVMLGSRFTTGTAYNTRTPDYSTWSPWGTMTTDFVSDGFVADTNTNGRVGVAIATPEGPLRWYESTNNGETWPATPAQLLPDRIPMGIDTFVIQQGIDLVHLNGDSLITFGVTKLGPGGPTQRDQGIGFWSRRTGFVLAVPHNSVFGVVDTLLKRQVNQNTVGYPSIGLSGSSIAIAFQAYIRDTSASGFNYADVFLTYSTNRGSTWGHPVSITSSQFLDERYPSISKWNGGGQWGLVYQEDPEPGSSSFGDGSPVARVRQVFRRNVMQPTPEENGMPTAFSLSQNYPNPFNPSTTIEFRIQEKGFVVLKVYDVLGREIATLVNEEKQPGSYEVAWDARTNSSGVYYYRIASGVHSETRRMILLK